MANERSNSRSPPDYNLSAFAYVVSQVDGRAAMRPSKPFDSDFAALGCRPSAHDWVWDILAVPSSPLDRPLLTTADVRGLRGSHGRLTASGPEADGRLMDA